MYPRPTDDGDLGLEMRALHIKLLILGSYQGGKGCWGCFGHP